MDAAKTLATLLCAALLARQAVLGLLDTVLSAIMKESTPATLVGGLAWTMAASLAALVARHVWRGAAPTSRRVGAALTVVCLCGLALWLDRSVHWAWFETRRGVAPGDVAYPYEAGRVLEEDRNGFHMRTVIGPDGTRPCGSGDEGPVVVVVGDSYAFGSGLPDELTLCWQLREALAEAGHVVRAVNFGQAGASLASTEANLRVALERYDPAVVWFSVLPGDDARAFDLNDQRGLVDQVGFRVASAFLDPDLLWLALAVFYEVSPPDPWDAIVAGRGLRRVAAAADEAKLPLVLDLLLFEPSFLAWYYLSAQDEVVASSPYVVAPERVVLTEEDDQGRLLLIPEDGHTTGDGNALRVAAALPLVVAALEGRVP